MQRLDFRWDWRHSRGDFLVMLIKEKPYLYQQMAFDFACNKFGITTPYITSNGVVRLMEMVKRFADHLYELTILKGSSAKKKCFQLYRIQGFR